MIKVTKIGSVDVSLTKETIIFHTSTDGSVSSIRSSNHTPNELRELSGQLARLADIMERVEDRRLPYGGC